MARQPYSHQFTANQPGLSLGGPQPTPTRPHADSGDGFLARHADPRRRRLDHIAATDGTRYDWQAFQLTVRQEGLTQRARAAISTSGDATAGSATW